LIKDEEQMVSDGSKTGINLKPVRRLRKIKPVKKDSSLEQALFLY